MKNNIYTTQRKELLSCRYENESKILLPIKVFKYKKDSLIESRKNYLSFIEIRNQLLGVLCIDDRGRSYVDCDYNLIKKDYQILYNIVKRFPDILFQIEKEGKSILFFKNDDDELRYILIAALNSELERDVSIDELRRYLNTVGLKVLKEEKGKTAPNTRKRLRYSWDSIAFD